MELNFDLSNLLKFGPYFASVLPVQVAGFEPSTFQVYDANTPRLHQAKC